MDPLTVPVVAILAGYAPDKGLELGAELGPRALEVAHEMYLLVLGRVARTRPETATGFPNDPETYEKPLQQALGAEIAADPGLADRLNDLLARYQQAAGRGAGAAAAGAQGMAAGGIRAGRIEAENVVSGVQVQGGSAADAAGLAQLAQAIRRGDITADQIAAGGNLITTGLLDSTLMVSYEHLVLMDELIGQIKSVTHGITTDPSGLALDVLKEHGHPSPDFLGSEHTLQHMKRDVYYSDYTGRTTRSYQEWYEKAHARVTRILDRQPAEEDPDPAIRERLAAVEARLREDGQSWRSGRGDWWGFYVQDL